MTADPAMLVWLNGHREHAAAQPNENYARELMELFTLGADRGAYTETRRARAGARADRLAQRLERRARRHNFRFDPSRYDAGDKTIFGKTGAFDWQDACGLCVEHPLHPSFFVAKLWSYFIPTPPSDADRARARERSTSRAATQIRPVVEAILLHPELYTGRGWSSRRSSTSPACCARSAAAIDTERLVVARATIAGQRLFYPPDVAGWDDDALARHQHGPRPLADRRARRLRRPARSGTAESDYDADETPEAALAAALAFWGNPPLSPRRSAAARRLRRRAASPARSAELGAATRTAPMRQNALRQLDRHLPDLQTS